MTRLTQCTDMSGQEGPTGQSATDPPLDKEDLCGKIRAYLECRSRHVDPSPLLAEAWDRFYNLYTPRIRAYLRRFRLPEADREDCLQDVWSKVLTRPADLPDEPRRARLWAWLMTVTRNRAVDALRRRRRVSAQWDEDAVDVVDAGPDPSAAYDRLLTQDRVRSVLDVLSTRAPALSFQVFYLRAIDGRTNAEVAALLGLTPEQARFRLHRMRYKFREIFEGSAYPDDLKGDTGQPRNG
jgi:RNA polymerase sigma-70 factor, ECF subfamily